MKRFFIIIILSGCGAAESKNSGATHDTTVPVKTSVAAPAADSQTPVSIYAVDASTLPACTAAAEGELAYVKTLSQFQACLSGAWQVVDVRGKDGASGKDGAVGAQGAVGVAGANGKDGAAGVAGVDGAVGADGATGPQGTAGADGAVGAAGADGTNGLSGSPGVGNFWSDPDTGTIWVFAAANAQYSPGLCPAGFAVVTHVDVLPTKFLTYLTVFLSTLKNGAYFWTGTVAYPSRYLGLITNGGTTQVLENPSQYPNATHAIVCRN